MKSKLFFSIVILYYVLFNNVIGQTVVDSTNINDLLINNINTGATYNSPQSPATSTRESQVLSKWLGGQDAGIMPLDIIYIDSVNKFFVYGYHRIVVLNGTNFQKEGVIDISDYGVSFPDQMKNYAIEDNNNFAYNPVKNELYCVTEDLKIIAIDPSVNQTKYTIKQGVANPNYDFKMIKYDERTDKIIFVYSGFDMSAGMGTNYANFYGTNYQASTQKSFNFFTYSVAVNSDRDVVYLSVDHSNNQHYLQLRSIDGNTLIKEQNVGSAPQGKLLYVNDNNNNIHKVFSFPVEHALNNYSHRYVIDGNTDAIQSFGLSTFITSAEYNPYNNEVYCAYQGGVYVYNADNNSQIAQINLNNSNFEEKTFCLKYNGQNKIIGGLGSEFDRISDNSGAYIIDGSTNTYTMINNVPYGFNIKADVNNTNNLLLVSSNDCSVSSITPTGNFSGKTIVGGKSRKIVYNSIENKVYSYDPHIGKIYVNDLSNNNSTIINLATLDYPDYISSVVFDKDRNRLYVALYQNNNEIHIIDCATDQVINDKIHTYQNFVKNLFYAGNKLYCTTGQATPLYLEFVNLSTLNSYSFKVLKSTMKWNYFVWFGLTKTNDIIVAVNNPGDLKNKIRIIDSQSNNIIENYNVYNPLKIAYNPLNNKIYAGSIDDHHSQKRITVIDRGTGQINYYTLDKTLLDIQYCDKGNYLAVLTQGGLGGFNPDPATVIYYDGKTNNVIAQMDVPSFASAIKYNPVNGNLYTLVTFHLGSTGHNRSEVWTFNHFYGINTLVELDMYETHLHQYISSNDMAVFNTTDNQLITTTSCHSKLNIVQCEDEMLKVNGNNSYTWISFPKLTRDETTDQPVSTRSVMEDIDPLPYALNLTYLTPPNSQVYLDFIKSGSNWFESLLPTVQSSLGYKLTIHNQAESWLHLYGTRLAPDYHIQLKAGGENWIGYFLQQNQSPLDALSQLLPNQLVSAKGHDWTLVDIATGPGNHVWQLTPQDAVIKYGDMVVVEVANDINIFMWNGFGNPPAEVDRTVKHYSYNEKADYSSLLIEPDTNNRPKEIGAFINDTCIGACVVLPADTLVLLKSYEEGYSGDSIVFQMFYGTKNSSVNKVDNYYVLNKERGTMEQRIVKTGEKQKFHLISFNKPKTNTLVCNNNTLSCEVFPNPVNNNSVIDISLTEKETIWLSLYSRDGKQLSTENAGIFNKGRYRLNLNHLIGNDLKHNGVYLLKIIAGSKTAVKKLIVIK